MPEPTPTIPESNLIKEKVYAAERILRSTFGIDSPTSQTENAQSGSENDQYQTYDFLSSERLKQQYENEHSKQIAEQLLSMSKTIRDMRSSYLPYEFFISSDSPNSSNPVLSQDYAKKEPYENTFLRMLGMPSVYISQEQSTPSSPEASYILADKSLYAIDARGDRTLKLFPFRVLNFNIFEQRKLPPSKRVYVINNNIYRNYDSSSGNFQSVTLQVGGLGDRTSISIENLTPDQKALLFSVEILSINTVGAEEGSGGTTTYEVAEITASGETSVNTRSVNLDSYKVINREEGGDRFINPIIGGFISPEALAASPIDALNEQVTADLKKFSSELFKFYYLLFPPIQEAEIANGINETSKIVAPPFSTMVGKKINNQIIKPTLLETIIRIRLDKVSGTQLSLSPSAAADALEAEGPGDDSEPVNTSAVDGAVPNSDDYGVLEALIILRLRAAISGFAKKISLDLEALHYQMGKIQRIPIAPPEDNPNRTNNSSPVYQDNDEVALEPTSEAEINAQIQELGLTQEEAGKYRHNKYVLANLKRQKVIEDSILSLLGDNSEVLELQANTQRRSSIYDSHLMSGLVGIVDIPRKRIEKEIKKLKDIRNRRSSEVLDPLVQSINTLIGTDIGVGSIDIAVFCLALFTLPEDSLLGLLTEQQFETIKNGEFQNVLGASRKKSITDSINELSRYIYSGYKLIEEELSLAGTTQAILETPLTQ